MDHYTKHRGCYGRFTAMLATYTVLMFGLVYLDTDALDHVSFSQTRMWIAPYMGAAMAIIMLAFMPGIYANRQINAPVAIMTSGRANILDPRMRAPANAMVEAQRAGIGEMKRHTADIKANADAPAGRPRDPQ